MKYHSIEENKMNFTQNIVTWNNFEPFEENYEQRNRGNL